MHKIVVVGIGPGNPDFVLPAGRKAIDSAKVLVGGKRALADFAGGCQGQETFPVGADIPAVIEFIRSKLELTDVVAMVSGDPGYFSLLDALLREFSKEIIKVIPGISSVQYAFSRLSLPWHEAEFISFHGRRPDDERLKYRKGRILGFITDTKQNSHSIPELLLSLGWPEDTYFAVGARLSYDDEYIVETTLAKASETVLQTHCVLVVKAE
ncbi:MAG: precorrin-6y C5,15-methyltransferase (decarboxylating) subunit CbiE [Selenomonadaceae bacterium]|nr:precorrin-6y C5,15-methyltransferase (decarboxylating) subunit CbiE [Selenomonadaceae bacterium]